MSTLVVKGTLENALQVSEPRFMLDGAKDRLRDLQCLKRSIGVIYRPETERESHYFEAKVRRTSVKVGISLFTSKFN
jgi:hypothetical protein